VLAVGALLDDICTTTNKQDMFNAYDLAANGTRSRAHRQRTARRTESSHSDLVLLLGHQEAATWPPTYLERYFEQQH
jgi:hypothetical protein